MDDQTRGLSRRSFLVGSGAALAGAKALANGTGEGTTSSASAASTPAGSASGAIEAASAQEISKVRRFISEQWKRTVRRSNPDDSTEIPLPKPFTVPTAGETFHYFFYWDTYFTSLGLLLDGLGEQARDNADNMIFLAGKVGFIPNITAAGGQNRTQLPVASALYADVFRWSGDTQWLAEAYGALEREYSFFQSMRSTPCGLNRAYHHATPQELWDFADAIRPRLPKMPLDPLSKLIGAGRALAECEVWDFTPRFEGRCPDFCPIDANALLCLMEHNGAAFCRTLGREEEAGVWTERAERRRKLLTELCWDEHRGMFFDYDWVSGRRGEVASAANYFLLWTGAVSEEQAARMARSLAPLEYAHGLTTCAPGERSETYQWDHPNAWPPLQFAAMEGLRRYGFHKEARQIAAKYVATVTRNFQATGNLWEKYNAVTGGIDVQNEYAMPPMLGWTAGVYLHALQVCQGTEGAELTVTGVLQGKVSNRGAR